MKTVYIVTGASGFLGGWIIRKLLLRGETVRAFVLKGEYCNFTDAESKQISVYEGDVCNYESLAELFHFEEETEIIVIHCAGLISISAKRDERIWAVNVEGTENVLEACKKHRVKKLIHISSVHAIPVDKHGALIREINHFSPAAVTGQYGKTKAAATQLVLDAAKEGLHAVVIQPSGLVGPMGLPQGPMTHLIKSFLSGHLPAAVQGGYDFVDVRDVAECVLSAVEKGNKGECYILSGRYVAIHDLLDILAEASGRKRVKLYLPMRFLKMTAPLAELYYRIVRQQPLFTKYSLDTISENSVFSHEKAERELGYKSRDFKETLFDTVAWFQKRKKVIGC